MSATLAGGAAIVFSVGAMLACLISVPAVYNRVSSIQLQLKTDMDEFQILTQDVWKEIVVTRNVFPARKARQAGNPNCRE